MAIFSASVGISDIFNGTDAYTVYLTNEAEVVPASNTGVVANGTTVTGNFKVLLGTSDVTAAATYTVVSASGSFNTSNVTVNSDGSYSVDVAGSVLGSSTNVILRATHASTPFDLTLSITRSDAATDGTAAKTVRVSADRQTFSFADSASATVSTDGDITVTVDKQNTSASTTWTVVNSKGAAPTASTYTATSGSNTATVTASAFGDNQGTGADDQVLFVKVTATADGLSDTITIYKIRQGDTLAVSTSGGTSTITSSNGSSSTVQSADTFKTFIVYRAELTAVIAGTPSNTGVVVNTDGSMGTQPSNWTLARPTPTASQTIFSSEATFKRTASVGNYALEQTWTAASAVSGVGGARGSRTFSIDVATLNAATSVGSALATSNDATNPWQNGSDLDATVTQGLRVADWVKNHSDGEDGTIVALDTVTVYHVANQWSATRYYTGSVWQTAAQVIDGNLLVQGSVAAQKLVLNSSVMEVSGNTLSIVGAALNRRHSFFKSVDVNNNPVTEFIIPIPFGAEKLYATGCAAGGGRPAVNNGNSNTDFWVGAMGGGGGGGVIQYPISTANPGFGAAWTHIKVDIGIGVASSTLHSGGVVYLGGDGGSTVISGGESATGPWTAMLTLGGGGGGRTGFGTWSSGMTSLSISSFPGTGGTAPSFAGFSGSGTNGQTARVILSDGQVIGEGGDRTYNGTPYVGSGNSTDWIYGTSGSGNSGTTTGAGTPGSSGSSGGLPTGYGCGGNAWVRNNSTSSIADAGGDGFMILDFGA